jgi:16S rRNA (cytidine1402-2'-O)-methyltransferase
MMTISTPQTASAPAKDQAHWSLQGHRVVAQSLAPGLYVVATPIGNLGDITLRSLSTLAAADVILAEDTRVAKRLLTHYAIQTPVRRFDAHASEAQVKAVINALKTGGTYALISDAGTPLLSDPGSNLVVGAVGAGINVVPLPGASAALAALVCAGLAADRFFFEGFLPPKSGDRRRRLRLLANIPGALVLYEAPHRIVETLEDCHAILGDRQAAIGRELTKLYETVERGTLVTLAAHYTVEAPRGEFVVVIAAKTEAGEPDETSIETRLNELAQSLSVKDAAAVVAGELGLPKREVYARALRIAGKIAGKVK